MSDGVRKHREESDMDQQPLFLESINDALKAAVAGMGGTKVVGARMRPEMSPDHAGRWLADCLNGDRREHLSPERVVWLLREARAVGVHHAMGYIAQECGYNYIPVEPADERAELQRQYIEAAKAMARMAERIERVSGPRAVA
jgi:hypothetical protein